MSLTLALLIVYSTIADSSMDITSTVIVRIGTGSMEGACRRLCMGGFAAENHFLTGVTFDCCAVLPMRDWVINRECTVHSQCSPVANDQNGPIL